MSCCDNNRVLPAMSSEGCADRCVVTITSSKKLVAVSFCACAISAVQVISDNITTVLMVLRGKESIEKPVLLRCMLK
jgi:hypothetical protein